ncbi:MAG: sigma-70 family RNA polymerase sigma factor, partial [Candidatus Zixiibacteriota bacterium]
INIDDCDYLLVADSDPEAALIRKEQAHQVQKALMQLELADREIIMLKHLRDHSYNEISALLNIPKGTVMSRLYYARKKLARLLLDYE